MENKSDRQDGATPLDEKLAAPMFVVALLFLLTTGAVLHLTNGDLTSTLAIWLLSFLGILYLLIVAEAIAHWVSGSKQMKRQWSYLFVPIMRLCPRDHSTGESAWIPWLGWQDTTRELESRLARNFSGPMILIALLVLPVVGVEFIYKDMMAAHPGRKFAIDTCSGFIWMAFAFEFVVMFSVVERRWRYCKQNWIDLAIVLLPLVSFMGAARLGRLVKLKQVSRTAKIYRMRGLAIRSWRAVIALDVIDTLLRRDSEQRIEKLHHQISEKQLEIDQLRQQVQRLKEKSGSPNPDTVLEKVGNTPNSNET